MATNQLLPFANGVGANVETFANWSALAQVSTGFGSGLAVSKHFNYILAQGGAAGYAIGKVVVDWLGQDATIDATTLGANFEAALKAKIGGPYLPLAGGKMTGEIVINQFAPHFVSNADDTQEVGLKGGPSGNPGARIVLRGRSQVGGGGWFVLRANSTANDAVELIGKPNKSLTWAGKEVERVNSIGTNWIRYENGLQMCWAEGETGASGNVVVTFPVAFSSSYEKNPEVIASSTGRLAHYVVTTTDITVTSVTLYARTVRGDFANLGYRYLAIGRWK